MHRAEKRIAVLEKSFPDRQPASRPRRRRDESHLFEKIEEDRKRRERWLANATTAQLEVRLHRIDRVVAARIRRNEREGYTGALASPELNEVMSDTDRAEVAGHLISRRGMAMSTNEIWHLVQGARKAAIGSSAAAAVLAAVEERVDAQAA